MYPEGMTDTEKTELPKGKPAKVEKPSAPKSRYAVVGKGVQDPVHISKLGIDGGKSLSVHHVQRRLAERGYGEVYRDRDGFWREGTEESFTAFRKDAGLPDDAELRRVLDELFDNDGNVEIVA